MVAKIVSDFFAKLWKHLGLLCVMSAWNTTKENITQVLIMISIWKDSCNKYRFQQDDRSTIQVQEQKLRERMAWFSWRCDIMQARNFTSLFDVCSTQPLGCLQFCLLFYDAIKAWERGHLGDKSLVKKQWIPPTNKSLHLFPAEFE